MTVQYDPATIYTGIVSPGAAALRRVLMEHFAVGDDGIIRDKDRCPPSGPKSEHCDGRAWDAAVHAPSPVGDALANWAVAHAEALGIQSVIWNHQVWGFGQEFWRAYTGPNPHVDHVHIGLDLWAAANVTEALVRAQFEEDDLFTPQDHDILVRLDADTDVLAPMNTALGRTEEKVNALLAQGGTLVLSDNDVKRITKSVLDGLQLRLQS